MNSHFGDLKDRRALGVLLGVDCIVNVASEPDRRRGSLIQEIELESTLRLVPQILSHPKDTSRQSWQTWLAARIYSTGLLE